MKDWVTSVENHPSRSIVRTQSGRIFDAKHLVIATAFKRRMNQLLNEFDYAVCKKQDDRDHGDGGLRQPDDIEIDPIQSRLS